jgi:hypothetical protein
MASFIAMAFVPDPLNNLNLFMASAFAVGFFGSVQDVATDGWPLTLCPLINRQKQMDLCGEQKLPAHQHLLPWEAGYSINIVLQLPFLCLQVLFA